MPCLPHTCVHTSLRLPHSPAPGRGLVLSSFPDPPTRSSHQHSGLSPTPQPVLRGTCLSCPPVWTRSQRAPPPNPVGDALFTHFSDFLLTPAHPQGCSLAPQVVLTLPFLSQVFPHYGRELLLDWDLLLDGGLHLLQ